MILRSFAVRDNAVDAFMPPFFARSKGEAIRSFTSAVQDAGHQFSKNKQDFVLYEMGVFDDVSGNFESTVVSIMSGLEVESQ